LVVGGGVDLSTCTSCLTEYDDSREFGSIGVRSGKVNNQGKAINQSINQSINQADPTQLDSKEGGGNEEQNDLDRV
jgi:hypothetical protein